MNYIVIFCACGCARMGIYFFVTIFYICWSSIHKQGDHISFFFVCVFFFIFFFYFFYCLFVFIYFYT
ncbi:hypothetical protein CKT23_04825 [Salmonella enterica subsp. enterica]|nr:hypothetical protein [Salmonella enterica subsp. enterica]